MDHNFFIHSSVDGRLGCFRVLAIVNSAAMNNGTQVSFFNPDFLRVYAYKCIIFMWHKKVVPQGIDKCLSVWKIKRGW